MTPSALFARPAAAPRRSGGPVGLAGGAERPSGPDADATATARTARTRAVEDAAQRWREQLVALSGASALSDVGLLGEAVIDLTAAHPSGIAQLYSGRTTRLSNLVREGGALVAARRAARTVAARTDELTQRYGMAPTYLAAGIATWTEIPPPAPVGDDDDEQETSPTAGEETPAPRTVRAPVLLRPVRLRARGEQVADLDIELEPVVDVNSVLVRALRARGVSVDTVAITASALTSQGFSPRAALERLALLGEQHLADFELAEQVLIGPFVHPGQVLVDDLEAMHDELVDHDVVAALAGDEPARAALDRPLPERVGADRPPQAERGVGDLDPDQQRVVDAVASGTHLFIDAPPGADVPGTLAAVVADAVASGRRVLYVPGTRRVGQALVDELTDLGLGELVLDLSTDPGWRTSAPAQLRAGLDAVEPPAQLESVRAIRSELVSVRDRLSGYVAALHTVREPWGCSAHAALLALAELTGARPGPRTEVRLSAATARALTGERRAHARERLARAAHLGAFDLRPHDTPWYGAEIRSAAAAHSALERTQRLAETELPQLQEDVERTTRQTGLTTATTVREWLEQLQMLDGVRSALDVFVPQIFERSAADMVIATSSRTWRKERGLVMRRGMRRRLRKQAKDLLRPGRPVADLHAELVHVQEQREIWRRHCPAGGWPRLPEGLSDMASRARQVAEHLAELQPVLAAAEQDLHDLPLDRLTAYMSALGNDAEALRLMPERSDVLAELSDLGLDELVADLTARRVPAALAGPELDLAWWTSVLEEVLRTDPALAGYDGPGLVALAEQFRSLDAEHVTTLPAPVRRAVVRRLQTHVRDHRDQAAQLAGELEAGRTADLRQIYARHPRLVGAIRPGWVVPPVLVPQLLPVGPSADLVLLDGVHHLPVEQAVGAVARGRQVVLVGDSRRGGEGLMGELAPLLPALTLPTDRAEREESIARFLAAHGYDDVIVPVPTPPGPSRTRFDLVEGRGMPAPGADAVESVQSEVDHVVDLVIDHALSRPERSLAVIALNSRHADRVREAVLSAVAGSASVAEFFDGSGEEPFVVVDADGAAGLRRDTVVLSLGYAKTPHGRVLHSFGTVSGPGGRACLVDALAAVREELVVVSCLAPGDIDRSRAHQPGPALLADLIDWAAGAGDPDDAHTPDAGSAPDPLLVDLAERLWRLGLTVVPQYGTEDGVRIPLAIGHPDLPGELLVAVLTDDAAYVAEPNLRRRDRHWVQRLETRGWRVHMSFSTAVFTDPQREAETIVALVLDVVDARRRAADPVRTQTVLPPLELEDDTTPAEAAGTGDADAAGGGETGDAAGGGAGARAAGADAAAQDDAAPAEQAAPETVGAADLGGEADGNGPVQERAPRPEVTPGLPLGAYSDDELDDLAAWIDSDGVARDDATLAAELRAELGITRRGAQVDAALAAVAARRQR